MEAERPKPARILDQIEALRRVPDYKKDFVQWKRLTKRVGQGGEAMRNRALESLKTCEKEMRIKWKVLPPFPPPQPIPLKEWSWIWFLNPLDELRSLEVISPYEVNKQEAMCDLVKGYDPLRIQPDYESFRQIDGKGMTIYRGGKHLCMIVDLTRTETELLGEMKGYLKYYQRLLPHGTRPSQQRGRRKSTTAVDIWKVYDLREKGVPVDKIARQMMTDDSSVSNPYQATYNAVKRAIAKTSDMIAKLQ